MNQILAILWDSYRLLLAKKLFWITLFLSILVGLLYFSIALNDKGFSVLFGLKKIEAPLFSKGSPLGKYVYMKIFTDYLVPYWMGVFSLVLALISVCPIFPDFLKKGSIDVAVSKPINRVTLFVVKYIGCLLFVAIQISLFCLICFIAQGIRLGDWNAQIFWAVPLVVLAFSLIFCVAVLVSIRTQSMIFSLLVALLVWGISTAVMWSETGLYFLANNPMIKAATKGENGMAVNAKKFHPIVEKITFPFPKSQRITGVLKNKVVVEGKGMTSYIEMFLEAVGARDRNSAFRKELAERHSTSKVIGTSLGFNLVILTIACWMFVRRDY